MLADGFNVAPDYQKTAAKADEIFENIPKRENGCKLSNEDRLSYLWAKEIKTTSQW